MQKTNKSADTDNQDKTSMVFFDSLTDNIKAKHVVLTSLYPDDATELVLKIIYKMKSSKQDAKSMRDISIVTK